MGDVGRWWYGAAKMTPRNTKLHALLPLVLLAACGEPSSEPPSTDVRELRGDPWTPQTLSPVDWIGYGQARHVDYVYSPESSVPQEWSNYRSLLFYAHPGDTVWARVVSSSGRAEAWIVGSDFRVLATARPNGVIPLTIPNGNDTHYYVMFREGTQPASVDVTLTGSLLDRNLVMWGHSPTDVRLQDGTDTKIYQHPPELVALAQRANAVSPVWAQDANPRSASIRPERMWELRQDEQKMKAFLHALTWRNPNAPSAPIPTFASATVELSPISKGYDSVMEVLRDQMAWIDYRLAYESMPGEQPSGIHVIGDIMPDKTKLPTFIDAMAGEHRRAFHAVYPLQHSDGFVTYRWSSTTPEAFVNNRVTGVVFLQPETGRVRTFMSFQKI
jgi:hypothetical protein